MSSSKSPSAGATPELIWLRPERTGRGPRPAHSRASIAAAAVALADAEGLDAVSMRRIAAVLGAGTMSLYNYVPKKEHLFDLMVDAISGEYELPDAPSGDVRADLRGLAHQQLAILRRHPWAVTVIVSRPSLGPNGLRFVEYFLATMANSEVGSEGSGSGSGSKLEMMSLLNGFVCQFAEWERGGMSPGQDREQAQRELVDYLTQSVMTGQYPHLAQALASAGAPGDPDSLFERSLGRVLTAMLAPPEPQ
ncbi:AcrR family transcriptional regulator [Kitasatospora sp. MAP12-15]|uniref:TetR/AcrR family transcriptional regulator n=1 Tax=unclassified Kitasatospora TaxID=2633591 RepID=UPI0024760FA6|nr:TetR/AcrR family transcriptional regulator [Kitasatospora sp. MAP12-44]MDH6114309.1 AcrR family transcriptional regulator [Kitasatospora sp. MAP12-44]